MKSVYALTLLSIIHTVFSDDTDIVSLFGTSPRRDLNFMELAKYDGYKAEQHYVTTEDGYILGLFRIPVKKTCSSSNGTIMFMHGLYLSGDDCLVPGPKTGHCQIYADNCYDVWVPNVRGNFYSRNHTYLDPDKDSVFWNFSFDEMALKDLPAVIDYVLLETGETQISYVAHSQGVTLLLILCTKMPKYNDKIKIGFGLSPTAWLDNSRFIVIGIQSLLAPALSLTDSFLNREVLARNEILQNSTEFLCGYSAVPYPFCSAFIFAAFGYNRFQITKEVLPVVVGHAPAGTSLKDFNRWGQVRKNGFSEYDYGYFQNLIKYGQANPPLYDVSSVMMRWILIGSENDNVANVTDVKKLQSKLPNASLCVLSDKTFSHLDFIYGKDIPNYITSYIMSLLGTGNQTTCP